MITYSIIKKSQLEGACRLDAEYYQPEYLGLTKSILRIKSESLDKIAQVTGGKRLPVDEIFADSGVPYLRVTDIYGTFIDLNNIKYISEKLHQLLERYQIKQKDILVTIVGNTVGLVGYNQEKLSPFNFTENCARIRALKVKSEYLLAVMLSKVGQLQVSRHRVGTAQPKLSLDRLRNFLIPLANNVVQERISRIVDESVKFYNQSKQIFSQAEQVLLEELGLRDFSVDAGLWSVVKLSEVKNAERMDADYFEPRYQKLFKAIKKRNSQTLGELASIKKGIEPGSEAYTEEGKPFIRVSSISKEGIGDRVQKFLSEEMYQELKKDFEPKAGEVLLTKDASIGMACVVREPVEGIISGGILRLKIKGEVDADYLALCLNSIVGQYQAERDAGGSIIKHWKPSEIKKVLIPVLPKPTQQKIADLVRQSHAARKKAKELLEEAKRTVERLIEGGKK